MTAEFGTPAREGWGWPTRTTTGRLSESRLPHYLRSGRSLCGYWADDPSVTLGGPFAGGSCSRCLDGLRVLRTQFDRSTDVIGEPSSYNERGGSVGA